MKERKSHTPALMRVLVVLVLIFFTTQLVMLAMLWRSQKRGAGEFLLPLPARVSAMVDMVEFLPPEKRTAYLISVNSSSLRASVMPASAFSSEMRGDESVRIQALKEAILRYSAEMNGRRIEAQVEKTARRFNNPVITEQGLRANFPMRLLVELRTGEWLVVETPSLLEVRFRNLPIGLFAGLFGLVISVLALISLWKQFRPLRDMARSARNFAETGKPELVKPGGSRDIRLLVNAFNDLQTRVSSLLNNRRLMMSAMSHDVRTYLTRLRLRIESLDEKHRVNAERTIEEIQALLSDSLAFAEAEAGAISDEISNLSDIFHRIQSSGQFGKAVHFELPAAGLTVLGQDGRLQRALVNLLSNAIKYGKTADVSVYRNTDNIIVEIADRGPGIPDTEKNMVFEPFYRREDSRNRGLEGAGLGLAISQRLIQQASGSIELLDRDGGGLIVRVRLRPV